MFNFYQNQFNNQNPMNMMQMNPNIFPQGFMGQGIYGQNAFEENMRNDNNSEN